MEKLPASTGWLWVKEGFALFRKQPAEVSTLFLAYMFLMLAVGIIPLLGQVLPLILAPVFSMAFMQACLQIEQGKKVYPNLLLTGFRSSALPSLLKLGVLYVIAAVIAIAASALIDGGVFLQIVRGKQELDEQTIREANLSLSMMFAAAVYAPAAMAFWYAAPLVMWQRMGVGKAVFYSFFAVWRHLAAFTVYGLAWILIGVFLPAIVSALIAMVLGNALIVMVALMTLSLVLTAVMYCSFYATYTRVFGRPAPAAAPAIEA